MRSDLEALVPTQSSSGDPVGKVKSEAGHSVTSSRPTFLSSKCANLHETKSWGTGLIPNTNVAYYGY